MTDLSLPKAKSLRGDVSNAEWETRVDLAACYRLVHHYGMDDLVYNHISARVPGEEGRFLINAYGMTYDEITASSLVKIDFDGRIVLDSGTGYGINQATMYFDGVGMHEYESVAIDLDEQKRLVRDLGAFKAMILRNHGLLAVGASVCEAFTNLFWLERACKAQVSALACNTKLRYPAQDVIEKTQHLYKPETRRRWGPLEWPALLRLADRKYPGFRD